MRNCDGCVACCNGTLSAMIYDEPVYRGHPCKNICSEKLNCTIYDSRPQLCQDFKCLWLLDENLPEWLKPSNSGLLIIYRPSDSKDVDNGVLHVHVVEGMKVSASALMHIIYFAYKNNWTAKLYLDDGREGETGYIGAILNFKNNYAMMEVIDADTMYQRTYRDLLKMHESKTEYNNMTGLFEDGKDL